MSAEEAKIINQMITRYLSRREHSYFELTQKLTQKGFSLSACEKQLDLFAQRGIQSDDRYVQSMVRNAYHNGKGPQVIRQTLLQHKIDSPEIEACIHAEDFDWFTAAINVRIKKFGEAIPTDFTQKQKQKRFLQYRGFEQEQIKEAFM